MRKLLKRILNSKLAEGDKITELKRECKCKPTVTSLYTIL